MSGFANLHPDILLSISEQLIGEGRPTLTLKSLRLVCHGFCVIASSLLFNHITIRVPRNDEEESSKAIINRSVRLIDFLLNNQRIRAQIQDLYIFRQVPDSVARDSLDPLNQLLTKSIPLLPLLPRLRNVRISRIGSPLLPLSSESEEPRFLEAVQELGSNVTLSVIGYRQDQRCYTHTSNPDLLLNKITCLKSLKVDILNRTDSACHQGPVHCDFDGYPSKDIASVILQNTGLKHLHLRLDGSGRFGRSHDLEATERQHALENIGKITHSLESLALEGKLHFTQSAWHAWESSIGWAKLKSLSVMSEPLIQEVTQHLVNLCSGLETLKLDIQHHYLPKSGIEPRDIHRFQTDIAPFLSSLTLTDLSLTGFHPNNLDGLKDSGARLQRLLFHASEGPAMWFIPPFSIQSPRTFTEVLISPTHLRSLQRACPRLEWLAFDISPFHLSKETFTSDLYIPISGHAPAAYHDLIQRIASDDERRDSITRHTAKSVLSLQAPNEDTPTAPDPIFMALTHFHSLQHVRLFVHGVRVVPWTFAITDAVRTFLWLRRHKVGVPLESLVVYCGREVKPHLGPHGILTGKIGPWIVYDMGNGRLYTTEDRETLLWEVEGADGSGMLNIVGREVKGVGYDRFAEWDRLEDLDTEGWAVPSEWP